MKAVGVPLVLSRNAHVMGIAGIFRRARQLVKNTNCLSATAPYLHIPHASGVPQSSEIT
jgi:hypothetical protein